MINKHILKNNIEDLRDRLYFLLSFKEPTDTTVVKCSQELDRLLVEYERFYLFPKELPEN